MNVIDGVLDALNAHDIDAFLACYAEDATIEDGNDEILAQGHDEIRARYGALFSAHLCARWSVLHRIDTGEFVVQHEEVTGFHDEPSRHVCVYLVREDLIRRERVFR